MDVQTYGFYMECTFHNQSSMMKNIRHTQSVCSTNFNTPSIATPSHSQHINSFSPVVLKQRLRLKCKQELIKPLRNKTVRKQRYPMWQKQTQHRSQVSWIIYNMLVGIYHNWLRLAPYILHSLSAAKRAQLEGIQKMIRSVMKDKEKILEMLKKYQSRKSIEQRDHQANQEADQYIDEQLLEKIVAMCNQIKFSTQVFNGEILVKKRVVKTQKQNILANKVIQEISKNASMNFHEAKMMLMGSDVSKVAQSIVDRIAIVKYMRKNKIKIDESILKPLKTIFQSQKNFDYDQSMTTAKVIEKIKSKFMRSSTHRPGNSQGHTKQNGGQKFTGKQKQEEAQLISQQLRISIKTPDSKQDEDFADQILENNALLDLFRGGRSRKKIGFIEEDEEWERRIRDSYYGDKLKKKNQQIYNQRKVVMNRELKRTKVKNILAKLKDEFQKKEQAQLENKSYRFEQPAVAQKQLEKIKKVQKANKKMISNRIEKITHKQNKQKQKELLSKSRKKSLRKNLSHQSSSPARSPNENDENSSQISQSTVGNQRLISNRSKKFLKPARIIRKKKLKALTNLFDKLNMENFSFELKAEENVVNKKKKIMNLLNYLQESGIIEMKSIKKIISNPKKNIQIDFLTGRKNIKRNKGESEYPLTSFFVVPMPEEKGEEKPEQCLPYSFLTQFNKQAIMNWRHKQYEPDEWEQFAIQKCKFLGMDYDLNTFMASNDAAKKKTRMDFDKEKLAIEMGLSLVKGLNQATIIQKQLNVERESACI